MAAGSASGFGYSEITGVRVDVEDHVGWVVSNDRVGVGGHVVQESIYPCADCCVAISLSAHKIVMSTARP